MNQVGPCTEAGSTMGSVIKASSHMQCSKSRDTAVPSQSRDLFLSFQATGYIMPQQFPAAGPAYSVLVPRDWDKFYYKEGAFHISRYVLSEKIEKNNHPGERCYMLDGVMICTYDQ